MKRLLILLLSVFAVNLSFGQYHKFIDTNKVWVEWTEERADMEPRSYSYSRYFFDGLVELSNGKVYHKVFSQEFYNGAYLYPQEGETIKTGSHRNDEPVLKALIREDTLEMEVYAIWGPFSEEYDLSFSNPEREFLLYDFTVEIGDSLYVIDESIRQSTSEAPLERVVVGFDTLVLENGDSLRVVKSDGAFGVQGYIEGIGGDGVLMPFQEISYEVKEINCVSKDSIQLYGDCNYPEYKILSTSEKFEEHGMLLYPNPAIEQTTIDFGEMQVSTKVQVLDGQGRVMMTQEFSGVAEGSLDLSSLGKGMYFIFVETDQGKRVTQVLMKE